VSFPWYESAGPAWRGFAVWTAPVLLYVALSAVSGISESSAAVVSVVACVAGLVLALTFITAGVLALRGKRLRGHLILKPPVVGILWGLGALCYFAPQFAQQVSNAPTVPESGQATLSWCIRLLFGTGALLSYRHHRCRWLQGAAEQP
jgi:hypothetical protein